MKRVVALWLPHWPIERLLRAEPGLRAAQRPDAGAPAGLGELTGKAADERAVECSVPRGGGWRPGARWAKQDLDARIAALPAHRRPAKHEFGRADEPAGNPFKVAPGDEVGTPSILPSMGRGTIRAVNGGGGTPQAKRLWEPPSTACGGPPPRAGEDIMLVTSHRVGSRIEIAAASPAAQDAGATPGMTLTSARAMLPDLIVRPADPEGDHAALSALATLLARRCSPGVAFDGPQGLLIDASGVAHLHGGEAAMARRRVRMRARAGFTARVSIADTPGAAHALSRCGPRVTICPPGAQDAALAPLPPHALRLDERERDLLATFGVATIGELAAMPRAPLTRRLGKALVARLDQALGRVAEPIDPIQPAEPIAVAQRFMEPIGTAEAIAHWLGTLVPKLADALAAQGLGARRIELIADRVDHVPQRIRIGLARPSRDGAHILKLLLRRIEDVEPGYGIDALTLHLRAAEPLGPEALIERLDEATAPDLAPLVDTLATRGTRTWRAAPVESDVPERSVAPRAPLDPPARAEAALKADDVRQLDVTETLHPWHPRWPRPARLLSRPEQLDFVIAELPDQPPRRFAWRGHMHRVVHADGPERIAGEWWRRSGERDAVRDYFRVEDEHGARFWLYRRGDGVRPHSGDLLWFIHGLFG